MTDSLFPELVDSHCHLHLLDLTEFNNELDIVMDMACKAGVAEMLCVCVELDEVPRLKEITQSYSNVFASVGVHPNTKMTNEVDFKQLLNYARWDKCIAIGETGLDYFRLTNEADKYIQHDRFRAHIRAARSLKKPLIIHTRDCIEDTLTIMKEENADEIGGVMHCFVENWDAAQKAMDLGFYISFSGIVTFKNAKDLQEVAKQMPIERMLIETDSPYLAPSPFRGKQNHPALVREVAKQLAILRDESFEFIAERTTHNFKQCFLL